MPPPALLNVEKGESIYKIMQTPWLTDSDGPIMWRFISKKRKDGQIELVLYTQRQDMSKYIMQHISFEESEYIKIVLAIKEVIWQFFPGADIEINDFEDIHPSNLQTGHIDKGGMEKIERYWFWQGLKNKVRWLFIKKPPK